VRRPVEHRVVDVVVEHMEPVAHARQALEHRACRGSRQQAATTVVGAPSRAARSCPAAQDER
jgi:hypothetical protein